MAYIVLEYVVKALFDLPRKLLEGSVFRFLSVMVGEYA